MARPYAVTLAVETESDIALTRDLARAVQIAFAVAAGIPIVALVLILRLPIPGGTDNWREKLNATLENGLLLPMALALPIWGVAFVMFLEWTGAVLRVVPRLARPEPRFGNAMLAASFFVPVFGLVYPFFKLRELDAALEPSDVASERLVDRGYRAAPVTLWLHRPSAVPPSRGVLGFWWASWLAALALLWRAGVSGSPDTSSEYDEPVKMAKLLVRTMDLEMCVSVAFFVVAVLTVVMVGRMQARLIERAARLRALDSA